MASSVTGGIGCTLVAVVALGIARWLILSLLGLFGMLLLAGASPAAGALHVPTPTGTFHVSTRSMALVDRARRQPVGPKRARSLVIQLWYPAGKGGPPARYMSLAVARFVAKGSGVQPALLSAAKLDATAGGTPLLRKGGWPVVLFSPGFGVERGLYAGLCEDLASHGYVVVAIDHPYDAGIVEFPDGHVVIPASSMEITKALKVRVADTRFILTELAQLGRSGAFAGRFDLRRVGMFGHSLGGAAAASAMLADSRIRAGVDLDGLLFDPVRTSGLSRPFMLMNAEPGFSAQPSYAGFWKRLRGPHYAVDVKGAQHFAFSDLLSFVPQLMRTNPTAASALRQLVGKVDGLTTLSAERAYIHAFFERSLRAKPQPLLTQTPGPFSGVRLTIGGKP
jgi:hypothetical protein